VFVNGELFVIGGATSTDFLGTIDRYSTEFRFVKEITRGLVQRRYQVAHEYKGKLYILGGEAIAFPDLRTCADVERYDPKTDSLFLCKPMPSPVRMAGSVIHEGKIYVIGGSSDFGPTRSVQIYDAENDQWAFGAPMSRQRECKAVYHNGKIYVVGGYDGRHSLRYFEAYDIARNSWETLPPLPTEVSAHCAVVIGNRLYTFGDYQFLNRICRYDFQTKRWIILESNLAGARHMAAAQLENIAVIVGGSVTRFEKPTSPMRIIVTERTPRQGLPSMPIRAIQMFIPLEHDSL
jgi:influenza virus NS1A-binding protein